MALRPQARAVARGRRCLAAAAVLSFAAPLAAAHSLTQHVGGRSRLLQPALFVGAARSTTLPSHAHRRLRDPPRRRSPSRAGLGRTDKSRQHVLARLGCLLAHRCSGPRAFHICGGFDDDGLWASLGAYFTSGSRRGYLAGARSSRDHRAPPRKAHDTLQPKQRQVSPFVIHFILPPPYTSRLTQPSAQAS